MNKFILYLFCTGVSVGIVQAQDIKTLRDSARILMQKSAFDNAIQVLDQALKESPDNLELLKDKAFAFYLKRDFASSIEIGKKLAARADGDVQSFQILGMNYKEIAAYKESDKMYKAALKKFPKSGLLYSEYGAVLAANKETNEAIQQWEKGIENDPNNSSNYYYASKYYASKNNFLWTVLYGEIFVDIESFSQRTAEIKNVLFNGYQKIFSQLDILKNLSSKGSEFEKAVAGMLVKYIETIDNNITPEMLTAVRTRFVLDWFQQYAQNFPFHLFDHQLFLLQEGYFDAYNQWLFGPSADMQKYNDWVNANTDDVKAFQKLQQNYIFKNSTSSYYPHN